MQNQPQPQDALTQAKALLHGVTSAFERVQLQGTGPIGLDFGHSSVNAVQLHRRGAELRIAATGSVPYPAEREETLKNPELLQNLINSLLSENGFRGNHAVVSAPVGEPNILSLSFKSASPADVPRHVMELVKERLGGSERDWLVDYLPVNLKLKNSQDTMVMAAAMPRQDSITFMEDLQQTGLHLRALEIAPQALERLLKHVEAPEANCVVINFGRRKSYLSHFLHGSLTMDREISVGLEDFITPICESLGLEEDVGRNLFYTLGFGKESEIAPLLSPTFSRLKTQIDRMNHYIASQLHGDGIDCIYLTGEVASWAQATQSFSTALGIQTKTLNPFDLLPQNSNVFVHEKRQAMHAVATGLALRWTS